MLVETYEVTECDVDGRPESESEALALIESLGLVGQQKLVIPETGERSPYRKMTAEEKYVISVVCPKKTEVKKYADSPIPVRVLQVAAHAMDLFKHVTVWHPDNADEKDPYLVGSQSDGYSTTEYYLLARWGDELLPWKELVKKAAAKARAQINAACRTMSARALARIESLTEMSDDEIIEAKPQSPSYYYLD